MSFTTLVVVVHVFSLIYELGIRLDRLRQVAIIIVIIIIMVFIFRGLHI